MLRRSPHLDALLNQDTLVVLELYKAGMRPHPQQLILYELRMLMLRQLVLVLMLVLLLPQLLLVLQQQLLLML